jgi:hypothetical protein
MELIIQSYRPLSGGIIPVIFDFKANKIAQPNKSLAHPGKEVVWECSDWLSFHKGVVRFFEEGRFASRVKLSKKDAIAKTNDVFMQHWERNAGIWSSLRLCGYGSEFYNYFKSVGLTGVTNIVQNVFQTASSVVQTTTNAIDKTTASAGNAIVNTTDTISNTAKLAKYVVPIALGSAVVFVGAYVYKNYVKGNSRVRVGGAKI